MVYSKYYKNPDLLVACNERWYSVEHLVHCLSTIRSADLSTHAAKTQAMARLANVPTAFVNETNRFPSSGYYIRESDGDWAEKFSQLRSCLTVSYRHEEVRTDVNSSERRFQSEQDSRRALYAILDRFSSQLAARDNFVDRRSFERRFRAKWIQRRHQPADESESEDQDDDDDDYEDVPESGVDTSVTGETSSPKQLRPRAVARKQ